MCLGLADTLVDVNFLDNELTGTVPLDLAELDIDTLILASNLLTGSLPNLDVGSLTHLDYFSTTKHANALVSPLTATPAIMRSREGLDRSFFTHVFSTQWLCIISWVALVVGTAFCPCMSQVPFYSSLLSLHRAGISEDSI